MSKTMIRVTSLDKRFGDNHVLKNINFEVEQGDVVAIIGSSGSGKSTLLRCLIDLEQADGGTIMIEDKALVKDGVQAPPAEIKRIISRMGVVFQHFNLFPHLSVRKNLQLAPRIVAKADKGTIEANTKKLLDEVGLSDRIDAMPSTLSGGEKQRVAIARALMMNPDIMLLPVYTGQGSYDTQAFIDSYLKDPSLQTVKAIKEKRLIYPREQFIYNCSQDIVFCVQEVARCAYGKEFDFPDNARLTVTDEKNE